MVTSTAFKAYDRIYDIKINTYLDILAKSSVPLFLRASCYVWNILFEQNIRFPGGQGGGCLFVQEGVTAQIILTRPLLWANLVAHYYGLSQVLGIARRISRSQFSQIHFFFPIFFHLWSAHSSFEMKTIEQFLLGLCPDEIFAQKVLQPGVAAIIFPKNGLNQILTSL